MILSDEELMNLLPGAVRLPIGWINTARAIESAVLKKLREQEPVFVVFDGQPDNEAPRFVEVETPAGFSVKVGEWKPYGKYWTLGPLFEHPAPQSECFDAWCLNPYTVALQKSIAEDYIPKPPEAK